MSAFRFCTHAFVCVYLHIGVCVPVMFVCMCIPGSAKENSLFFKLPLNMLSRLSACGKKGGREVVERRTGG